MSGTPEMRNLEYDVTIIEPPLETPLSALRLKTRWSRLRTFFHSGTVATGTDRSDFRTSLSREERQMVLAGTRNDTEYTAIVTQLRGAWYDQDLRDRDRGSKSFGMGRTVHFAEADTEWYAEQIAHSISGDASELEVTWSFDLVEAIWWCGVLDLSIPESDVMDWFEDGSCCESSPCAEDVFPEQSQNVPSTSRKGKGKGKLKGKSRDSSCLICGQSDHFWRQCPERQLKGSGKGGKKDLARFIWELLGVLILNCLRQWYFKRILSWTVVRQKQLVESWQCRFWWMQ